MYSIRQPLGVVAGITPFNFPAMVPMWMFANALACGNTFVLKPSEKDPSVNMFVAELLAQAGLPAGCFNVVQGDKVAVDRILEHDDVAAVSFVGSTPIAKYIYETGTKNGKRVQALGGAKNHMLVLNDADVDMAADAAVSAGYGSAGERCMAISVVLAADAIADELVAKIAERIPSDQGRPRQRTRQRDGPADHRRAPRSRSAATSTAPPTVAPRSSSTGARVFRPTATSSTRRCSTTCSPGMACYDDEIFGPVLSVMRVSGYQEGLDTINASPYANGTAIFTRDGGAARQFQFDVQVGMVGVNVPVPVPVSYYSFGGWKASLFGDTHMYGPEGINFYTQGKVVTSRWPDPATSTVDLGFPETDAVERSEHEEHMDIGVVLQTTPPAARVIDLAKRAETYGFSHVWTFDSHILWEEPYVIYSQILAETRNVIVGPMVTNPATRDWTVTASTYATLNEMYGNRTVCGIGRGDSAVRVTNGKPTTLATMRESIHVIRELAMRPRRRVQRLDDHAAVGVEERTRDVGCRLRTRRR